MIKKIDIQKFAAYSKPGPRYTSYPTANEFHENFSYDDYIKFLTSDKSSLSLYIHLPFCRSACYFCGCNVIYTSKQEKKNRYIKYLNKELHLLKQYMDCSREVVQLHLGGGTPTFMSHTELKEILDMIYEVFPHFSLFAENSCEIDPRYFSKQQMQTLHDGKINRLSFGIQDFDINVQNTIHRIQSQELVSDALKLARDFGVHSINFDLIYGLPKQNLESFKRTLDIVYSMKPERLAIFNYAHVPWLKKNMRKINEHELPSPREKLQILDYTINFLQERGYMMIGMDHFAQPHDELYKAFCEKTLRRNFQGYTTKRGTQTIGIGLSAIGEGQFYYAQNHKELHEYEKSLDKGILPLYKGITLSEEDYLRKTIIMEIMSNLKLDYTAINETFKINFCEYFKHVLDEMKEFEQIGLVELKPDSLEVTADGILLVRNLVMPFDSFLKKSVHTQKQFSKTI